MADMAAEVGTIFPGTKAQVLDIAQKTSELVGGKTITAEDIVLNEEYAYPVYGVPSAHLALSWARRTWEGNQQGGYFPAHLRGDKKTPRTFRWSFLKCPRTRQDA